MHCRLASSLIPRQNTEEPPVKKLAIRAEPAEHEKFDFVLTPKMYVGDETVDLLPNEKVRRVIVLAAVKLTKTHAA